MIASFTTETLTVGDIVAGNSHLLTARQITLVSGQDLVRGAVLGKITTGGKYTLSLSASSDGSETPDLILAEDTDASGGDKTTVAYERGDFLSGNLTIGTGHTVASIREGLRVKGITLIEGA